LDKPAATEAPFFALSDHAVLALDGRDAVAFTQAQCMSDVAALADGQWQWSGWLSPKGRVQALFALLRVGPETIWLLLPDGDAAALKAAMERFVFRSKVKLRVADELPVSGAFAVPVAASAATAAIGPDGVAELDVGDGERPRTLRIGAPPAHADSDALARWRAYDLAHGLPRPGTAALDAFTPQQLSLDRLRAYSVRKGCYPGQEIVARTHFLGQAKRGLGLFGSAAVPAEGASVTERDRAIGTVVAAAPAASESSAYAALVLAVLPVERDAGGPALQVDGAALSPLSLQDGLAR
jgi:folate-binding protein YgfZ